MGRSLRVRDLSGKCIRMTMLFAAAVAGFFFVCAEELGQCIYHSADAGRYLRIFAPMVLMLYLDAIGRRHAQGPRRAAELRAL